MWCRRGYLRSLGTPDRSTCWIRPGPWVTTRVTFCGQPTSGSSSQASFTDKVQPRGFRDEVSLTKLTRQQQLALGSGGQVCGTYFKREFSKFKGPDKDSKAEAPYCEDTYAMDTQFMETAKCVLSPEQLQGTPGYASCPLR